jgi:para-nitrobenzyl esterase
MTRRAISICAFLLIAAGFPAHSATPPVATAVVDTESGPIQGLVVNGIQTFKGIPYAAPPIGERRFLPPAPAEAWTDIHDATDFGAPAIQMYDRTLTGSDISLQLATIFTTRSDMKIDNEDCLYLNVWTPALDGRKRPVMVWFHGGGYAYGSGAWPVYDGASLAKKGDVVVVTVNHRLNVFGYLYLAELGEEYAASGNAGMLDLVASLEWVRDNISGFGGNPDSVTIMGESGGGSKVSTLLAMPAAKGLFHKAIIQSGPGLTATSSESASKSAKAILAELGVDEISKHRLAELHTEEIVAAVAAANEKARGAGPRGLPLSPVVDGTVLPRDPFTPDAPEVSKNVPILIGWNKDEWTIFTTSEPWFGKMTEKELPGRAKALVGEKADALIAIYQRMRPDYSPTYVYNAIMSDSRMLIGSALLAERKAAAGGAPAYMYHLAWETPVADGIFKSPHTLDIPFMFNNVDRGVALTGDSPEARRLEDQMSSSWISFARTGNPNNETVPEWPAYDAKTRATMVFDVEPEVVNDVYPEVRKVLAQGRE